MNGGGGTGGSAGGAAGGAERAPAESRGWVGLGDEWDPGNRRRTTNRCGNGAPSPSMDAAGAAARAARRDDGRRDDRRGGRGARRAPVARVARRSRGAVRRRRRDRLRARRRYGDRAAGRRLDRSDRVAGRHRLPRRHRRRVRELLRPDLGSPQGAHPPGAGQPRVRDRLAPPATTATSARRPAIRRRATTATTWAPGTSSSLNSNCSRRSAARPGSPRSSGCAQDLAAHPTACTLAYWHHPRFSSGRHGNATSMRRALAGAAGLRRRHGPGRPRPRLRAAPPRRRQRRARSRTASGSSSSAPAARPSTNSFPAGQPAEHAVRNGNTNGVLKLTLHATSYDWQFIPIAGQTFTDTGSANCH